MKVLVVEDDEMLAGVLDRNLQAHGHSSRRADTAEEALLQMKEDLPDAVILDVNLPDSSAWEVLRRLGDSKPASLRVIIVSAAPISRKRLDEFRPYGSLQKPFAIGSLLHLLEEPPAQETIDDSQPQEGQTQ